MTIVNMLNNPDYQVNSLCVIANQHAIAGRIVATANEARLTMRLSIHYEQHVAAAIERLQEDPDGGHGSTTAKAKNKVATPNTRGSSYSSRSSASS